MAKKDNHRATYTQSAKVGDFEISGTAVYSFGEVQLVDYEDDATQADETTAFFAADPDESTLTPNPTLELLAFVEDHVGNTLTIDTNSATSPDDTFAISSTKPLIWAKDAEFAVDGVSILSARITSLHLSASASKTKFRAFSAHSNLGD